MKIARVTEIEANPYQPRGTIDEKSIEEMVASMKKYGLLQPILVRSVGEKLQIAAGERRFRAAVKAGLVEIPVIEKELNDREMLELAMIENIHREDMSPLDKARGFKRLMDEFKLTQGDIAEIFGISRPAVANTVRLLGLPEKVKNALEKKEITEGHARALLAVRDDRALENLTEHLVEKRITVRECEDIVRKITSHADRTAIQADSDQLSKKYEELLSENLGLRVRIKDEKGRGRIEIDFYSYEDIERLVEITSMESGR